LAADFQRQLASKANEVVTMKQFFEKTRGHLVQLQSSIKELRQERHQLANEVMAATAVNVKLKLERDLLRSDFQSLLEGLDGCAQDILQLAIKFKRQALETPKSKPAPEGAPARKLLLSPGPTSDLEIKWLA
jgi:chromosome segregation ATPase